MCARARACLCARMCVRVCCGDGPSVPLQLRTKRAYSGLAMMVCIFTTDSMTDSVSCGADVLIHHGKTDSD